MIEDVSIHGPAHEVRFVDSVYSQSQKEEEKEEMAHPVASSAVDSVSHEENRKKSQSLNTKLQLMKLQLEIKKKELEKKELERKRRSLLANNEELKQPPEQDNNTISEEHTRVVLGDQVKQDISEDEIPSAADTLSPEERTRAKVEQLRRRQKELKQKNDIANLRNLLHRQRELLKAQGKELSESSTQLQACANGIKEKEELLDQSKSKLDEMNRRKLRLEGMARKATEQLMRSREALSKQRQLNT